MGEALTSAMSAPVESMPMNVSNMLTKSMHKLTEGLSKSEISDDVEGKKVDYTRSVCFVSRVDLIATYTSSDSQRFHSHQHPCCWQYDPTG